MENVIWYRVVYKLRTSFLLPRAPSQPLWLSEQPQQSDWILHGYNRELIAEGASHGLCKCYYDMRAVSKYIESLIIDARLWQHMRMLLVLVCLLCCINLHSQSFIDRKCIISAVLLWKLQRPVCLMGMGKSLQIICSFEAMFFSQLGIV